MRPYRICDNDPAFLRPDPENPGYSLGEVDVYAHDPTKTVQGRLSIRRNLRTRQWEIYRAGWNDRPVVLFTGTLQEVCDHANEEWGRAWGSLSGPKDNWSNDQPCDHMDNRSSRCGAETRESQQ